MNEDASELARKYRIEISVDGDTIHAIGVRSSTGSDTVGEFNNQKKNGINQPGSRPYFFDGFNTLPPNLISADCDKLTPEMLPLAQLDQDSINRIIARTPGGLPNIQDIFGLLPMQEGILFHHILTNDGDPYLLVGQVLFPDRALLDRYLTLLQKIVDRHDILRTSILWDELCEPVQVVWRKAQLSITDIVLDPAEGPAAEQMARRFDPNRTRIDLTQAPLLRVAVAQDPDSGQWILTHLLHHLVGDDSALEFQSREIGALLIGNMDEFGPVQSFRALVAQARLGVDRKEHERFFTQLLKDIDEPTAPFCLQDIHCDGSRMHKAYLPLEPALSVRLRASARRLGVSVATLCHVAWGLVVARTSGRQDIVFGTVLLNSISVDEDNAPATGRYINTLPMRMSIDDMPIVERVHEIQELLADLLRHEHASLALTQRCSGVAAPAALFTTLLNYRHNPDTPHASASLITNAAANPLQDVIFFRAESRTHYPITLSVEDYGQEIGLTAQVAPSLSPERICGYMRTALDQLANALEQAPETPIRTLDILPAEERHRLLVEWNDTASPYPADQCVHQLFEAQAALTPKAIAVVQEGEELSYADLNARANQLARYLRALGVSTESRVAVCMERRPYLIVGLLGVLKAGGTYVPLDPHNPPDRLSFMLKDCTPAVLLADPAGRRALPDYGAPCLDLTDSEPWSAMPTTNLDLARIGPTPSDLAYIIYTSGSMGWPKGVAVPHRAVICLVMNNNYADIAPNDRVAFASNPAFDASTFEIWAPLLNGASMVPISKEDLLTPHRLGQTLKAYGITVMWLTTGLFNQYCAHMGEALSGLRIVIFGGDASNVSVTREFMKMYPSTHLLHAYGPTESTTFASTFCVNQFDDIENAASLPIGRPISNTRLYVLDARGSPVPIGVMGELYVGGNGVALGYLNRPELTAERFLPDPFNPELGTRMYRTGDLVRYRPDGNLEFLGRNDLQVKIRGFRIELGEIETRLTEYPGISGAAVMAREDKPGYKRLVAYLALNENANKDDVVHRLRSYLADQLPDYMLPATFVTLDALPLTPNGKVDRRSLPAPHDNSSPRHGYEPPQGETETALAAIWSKVLCVKRIGRFDNFFDLGGHSLLAVHAIAATASVLNSRLQLEDFLRSPTIAHLASTLQQSRTGQCSIDEIDQDYEIGSI
jgi:amino acid adenylation domain-containing protein